jgi:hypothetical protein
LKGFVALALALGSAIVVCACVLCLVPGTAVACSPYNPSCNSETMTVSVVGQVFVVLLVVSILGSLIWWRFGSGGPLARFLLWRARRRSRRTEM